MSTDLRSRLASALNASNAESGSNTPDFLLAKFLCGVLQASDTMLQERATWYGRPLEQPGQPPQVLPSEVLFAFVAWLTGRTDAITIGHTHDCAPLPPLITQFCASQGWENPRENWTDYLKPYPTRHGEPR